MSSGGHRDLSTLMDISKLLSEESNNNDGLEKELESSTVLTVKAEITPQPSTETEDLGQSNHRETTSELTSSLTADDETVECDDEKIATEVAVRPSPRPTSQRRRGKLIRAPRISDEALDKECSNRSNQRVAVGHEDSLELDCEGDSPKVQESADVKKALDLSPVMNNNSTNASYHGGTALTPSRLRHLADEVEYIDQEAAENEGDLLEWLTLYDAPRQSKADSDL